MHACFEGRPEFLELDLGQQPTWGPLCTLLDVPEPDEPFPWANRGQERERGPAKRLLTKFTRK